MNKVKIKSFLPDALAVVLFILIGFVYFFKPMTEGQTLSGHDHTGGVGSGAHMASVLLAKTFGLDLLHVPFQGAGPAQHSLLSGRTVFLFDNLQHVLQHLVHYRDVRDMTLPRVGKHALRIEVEGGGLETDV